MLDDVCGKDLRGEMQVTSTRSFVCVRAWGS
jgi:hypothetical protein